MAVKKRVNDTVRVGGYQGVSLDQCKTHLAIYNGPDTVYKAKESVETYGHDTSLLGKGDDIGGPFVSSKQWVELYGTGPYHLSDGHGNCYHGHVMPWDFTQGAYGGDWPTVTSASSTNQLLALGTTAIARSLPTNPVGSAAQFLGELREGLPHLVGHSLLKNPRLIGKGLGQEYLNIEFAIKPFISDLQKFGTAVKDSEKILKQLERDSGKNVHRRYQFPPKVTQTQVRSDNSNSYVVRDVRGGAFSTYTYLAPGTYGIVDTTYRRQWFSGCFTYYLPPITEAYGLSRFSAQANKLFGVRLTPELLWELTPWSWAADWFSNMGDVLHNLSAFNQDGLVMRYGYIMEETTSTRTVYASQKLLGNDGKPVTVTSNVTFGHTIKTRLPASPFGFGIDIGSLTPRQIAISAALGLSRGRR